MHAPRRAPALVASSLAVLTLASACASKPPANAPQTTASCGLALYGPQYDPRCQSNLDAMCCAAERACADDPGCRELVACMNACQPSTDRCLNACARPPTARTTQAFNELGRCSKTPEPASLPPAAHCGWPGGGGPPHAPIDLRLPAYATRWNPSPGCEEMLAVDAEGDIFRARSCPPESRSPLLREASMGRGFREAVAADFAPLRAAWESEARGACPPGRNVAFMSAVGNAGGEVPSCLDDRGRPVSPTFARAWDRLHSATPGAPGLPTAPLPAPVAPRPAPPAPAGRTACANGALVGESVCTRDRRASEQPGPWLTYCAESQEGRTHAGATLCSAKGATPLCVAEITGGKSRAACCPAGRTRPTDAGCVGPR